MVKRFICMAFILFVCFHAEEKSLAAPITTLHALSAITNDQAREHAQVIFEATVTYYRPYEHSMFVQDGNDAIFVYPRVSAGIATGDRVLIEGAMHESYRPYVDAYRVTRTGHGALPTPIQPTFDQMIRGNTDGKLVTVTALIRSADLIPTPRSSEISTYLHALVDGEPVDVNLDSDNKQVLKTLLDSEAEITGVVSGHFDNKMQLTGMLLHVQSLNGIKILKHPDVDPWSLPLTPMNQIITGYRASDNSARMRVEGTVTYYQPGAALVLQNGAQSIWITTDSWEPLRLGDRAEAIGFPTVSKGFLQLTNSQARDSGTQALVTPSLFNWNNLAMGGNNSRGHLYDLVSIEGEVIAEVRQSTQDEYVLKADGHLFSAILSHPALASKTSLASMRQIPLGSRIRVTGICTLEEANPFNGEVPFNILLRSLDDIVVVASPPWLNVRNISLFAGLLLFIMFTLGTREWYMERRTRRQIGFLAYVEQRRSRILEDINHSRPLAEILERITEWVSLRLNGAASWCQVTDGATLGNKPEHLSPDSMRTVMYPIASRSGPPLGTILAAFDAQTEPTAVETEALAMAAGLATLAIETSRLYSDLVHRSEFDLLTDAQNRFAMDKALNGMILKARQSAGIFGLIYIDLDKFKLVNDTYGHQVGDLYLQEAVLRMKRQLRPDDLLARLGGDEFAALVPEVRSRADVEEIARRLEECFTEPFVVHQYHLLGTASLGIALYPEDASTADELLKKADSAMYSVKNASRTCIPHR